MPLIAWSALAYAAGLIAGFTLEHRSALAIIASLIALTLGALHGRRRWLGALAAVAGGATCLALGELARERACGAVLMARNEWSMRVDAPVAPGGIARGELSARGCRRRATVLVESGRGAPGDALAVRGDAAITAGSMLIERALVRRVGKDALLLRLRAATGRRIDSIFGADAPMVRALVIADMSAIEREQRDLYARAGLVHMLSVSGLHVGIIAFSLQLLGAALRLPGGPVRLGTLALLIIYVAAIGAPPPAVRAAVMIGVLIASRMRQRPTSPWAILAVGAVVPLALPRTVLDLGWQLSVAGTAALVSGGVLAKRVVPRRWRGVRRTVASGALISVVATLVTAPLVAWSFGRISLVGPLTNLFADPVMGLLQPLLFVALCIPVPFVERLCADATHGLIAAFDGIARAGAALPGAAPHIAPSTTAALLATVAAVAVLVACVAERPTRACITAASAIALLIIMPMIMPTSRMTELHMLDVGQGDALALRTRAGQWILVDAGRSWLNGDAGKSTVVPYIAHRGGSLVLFVLSHPHADHVGGAASTFAALRPRRFLDPGYVGTSAPYLAALSAAARQAIPWQRVRPGDSLVVDEVVLTALAPDSAWASGLDDANLASTVLMARIGAVRILFTGDAEDLEEEWLLERHAEALAADVLKVAHHGSRTSTTPAFLAAVKPRLALVSVGARNTYGHPDAEVMQRLHASGAQVLRTDRAGTVVVRTDGKRIDVEARDERWSIPERRVP